MTAAFRDALKGQSFEYLPKISDIESGKRYWMEIGDIDTKGHQDQSGLVRRVDELFDQIPNLGWNIRSGLSKS